MPQGSTENWLLFEGTAPPTLRKEMAVPASQNQVFNVHAPRKILAMDFAVVMVCKRETSEPAHHGVTAEVERTAKRPSAFRLPLVVSSSPAVAARWWRQRNSIRHRDTVRESPRSGESSRSTSASQTLSQRLK